MPTDQPRNRDQIERDLRQARIQARAWADALELSRRELDAYWNEQRIRWRGIYGCADGYGAAPDHPLDGSPLDADIYGAGAGDEDRIGATHGH